MVADLFPDARASFFDERAHGPIHRALADVIDEILQDLFATRRMRDFGMKLQSVEFALWIFHRCEVATLGGPGDAKTLWQRCDLIAVAVPDVELVA